MGWSLQKGEFFWFSCGHLPSFPGRSTRWLCGWLRAEAFNLPPTSRSTRSSEPHPMRLQSCALSNSICERPFTDHLPESGCKTYCGIFSHLVSFCLSIKEQFSFLMPNLIKIDWSQDLETEFGGFWNIFTAPICSLGEVDSKVGIKNDPRNDPALPYISVNTVKMEGVRACPLV